MSRTFKPYRALTFSPRLETSARRFYFSPEYLKLYVSNTMLVLHIYFTIFQISQFSKSAASIGRFYIYTIYLNCTKTSRASMFKEIITAFGSYLANSSEKNGLTPSLKRTTEPDTNLAAGLLRTLESEARATFWNEFLITSISVFARFPRLHLSLPEPYCL